MTTDTSLVDKEKVGCLWPGCECPNDCDPDAAEKRIERRGDTSLVERLEYLSSSAAEAMSDYERINCFVNAGVEATAALRERDELIEKLQRWKALDKPLTAAMEIAQNHNATLRARVAELEAEVERLNGLR